MILNRFVMSSISLAAMGLALSGVAYGQEIKPTVPPVTTPGVTAPAAADTGIADGAITRNGKLEADASTSAQTPSAGAAASANVNAPSDGIDANAAVGTEGQILNSQTNSSANPGLNVQPHGNQNSNIQPYNSGQDYSVGRPSYDMVGNSGNYSGMSSAQGYQSGSVASGYNPQNSHTCCSASLQVSQSYHHARRHRGGRQHHNRHCCR